MPGIAGPSGQTGTLPTRPVDDPLPPLSDTERKAFVSIFNRHNPIGGVITGPYPSNDSVYAFTLIRLSI
jgi:hypothetical protein